MKIIIECDDTPTNRLLAANLFYNIRERGNLPITRSLADPYEMGKVNNEIQHTGLRIED